MFILVIEDNPDLIANIYDYFEAKKHDVDAAYDAYRGIELALKNHYDVIILDLMLPGMDGLGVCKQLRDKKIKTPILMLTARDTLQDKIDGFASGADDYLVKPFALQELEVRLQALVRRAKGDIGREILRVCDLEYNPETYLVKRAGQIIDLPPIPIRILEYLMRRSPRTVSRAEIERHIWGNDRPDTDALRAHMHTLRTGIDKPFNKHLLRTIRGMGYQLADTQQI